MNIWKKTPLFKYEDNIFIYYCDKDPWINNEAKDSLMYRSEAWENSLFACLTGRLTGSVSAN
jgi:hypothetical protein